MQEGVCAAERGEQPAQVGGGRLRAAGRRQLSTCCRREATANWAFWRDERACGGARRWLGRAGVVCAASGARCCSAVSSCLHVAISLVRFLLLSARKDPPRVAERGKGTGIARNQQAAIVRCAFRGGGRGPAARAGGSARAPGREGRPWGQASLLAKSNMAPSRPGSLCPEEQTPSSESRTGPGWRGSRAGCWRSARHAPDILTPWRSSRARSGPPPVGRRADRALRRRHRSRPGPNKVRAHGPFGNPSPPSNLHSFRHLTNPFS